MKNGSQRLNVCFKGKAFPDSIESWDASLRSTRSRQSPNHSCCGQRLSIIRCFAKRDEPYSGSGRGPSSLGGQYTVNPVWERTRSSVMIDDMGRIVTLERRIQELCIEAVAAKDADELQPIMDELKSSLHEHNEELELMVGEYPFLLDDLSKPAA